MATWAIGDVHGCYRTLRKLLKKIDGALARIEDGSYGFCEETGEPIGLQRLIARPTATLSIEAQERRAPAQRRGSRNDA